MVTITLATSSNFWGFNQPTTFCIQKIKKDIRKLALLVLHFDYYDICPCVYCCLFKDIVLHVITVKVRLQLLIQIRLWLLLLLLQVLFFVPFNHIPILNRYHIEFVQIQSTERFRHQIKTMWHTYAIWYSLLRYKVVASFIPIYYMQKLTFRYWPQHVVNMRILRIHATSKRIGNSC